MGHFNGMNNVSYWMIIYQDRKSTYNVFKNGKIFCLVYLKINPALQGKSNSLFIPDTPDRKTDLLIEVVAAVNF